MARKRYTGIVTSVQTVESHLPVLVVRERLVELTSVRRNLVLVAVGDMARGSNRVLVVGAGQALVKGRVGAPARLCKRTWRRGRRQRKHLGRSWSLRGVGWGAWLRITRYLFCETHATPLPGIIEVILLPM